MLPERNPGVHGERRGDGVPIVFTHGYGADSSTWTAQTAALEDRWTVVTWDLPAHGRSPEPDDGCYTRELALAALTSVVDDRPAVLVGHSFGGYLSLLVAITRPELVSGLVLIATGPGYRNDESRAKWNDYARRASAKMDPPLEASGMLLQRDSLVIDNLSRIAVPVLHIVGGDDRQFHAGHSYLQSTLPDARALVIDGAGHHPHAEKPEPVNAAIGEFLTTLDPTVRTATA